MPLPARRYYSLPTTAQSLNCSVSDLIHWAIHDEIKLSFVHSCSFDDAIILVRFDGTKDAKTGALGNTQERIEDFYGLLDAPSESLLSLEKGETGDRKTWVSYGYLEDGTRAVLYPYDGRYLHLTDLVIRASEFDRLHKEARSKIDSGMSSTERTTLLTIIAALCRHSGIDPKSRGASTTIARLTEVMGAPVSDDTARRVLTKLIEAVESRMK